MARGARRFLRSGLGVASSTWLVLVVLFSLVGPYVVPYRPEAIDMMGAFAPPSGQHLLGTDELGRDVVVRLMYGGRITLLVGFVAMLVAVVLGLTAGLASGFFGGWSDYLVMRATDSFMSVPAFFVMLTILTFFGSSIPSIVLAIAITSWMNVARVVRSEVLRIRRQEYIEGARAVGARALRLLLRHALPNVVPTVIVSATLGVAWAILVTTSLSYLGVGVQAPTPSWGNMLTNSQNYFWISPLLVVYPGLMVVSTILAVNFLGEALRDLLSPRGR